MRRLRFPLGLNLIFASLTLLTVMSITITTIAAQEQPPVTGVLQVTDTDPLAGQELELNAPIHIYFDRSLDCGTLTEAFLISPTTSGDVLCGEGDTSLVFTPAENYQRATAYTIIVNDSLRGADGTALAEPFTLELMTVGFLRVTDALPDDGTVDIAATAVITVIFNRPVVPVVAAEDMADLPNPLTISPAVEGQGEWLNTSIYTFTPDPAWAASTTYTVTVNAGLTTVDESPLAEDYVWSFTTAAPQVVEVMPLDAAINVRLDDMLQIRFNQPIDRASFEANFYVRPQGTANNVPGEFEWSDDGLGVAFRSSELLALETTYEAGFADNSILDLTGQTALPAFAWTFATVRSPAIIGTDPFDGQTDVAPLSGFAIYFASPMDAETLDDKFTIEPEPWSEPQFYYSDYDFSLYVNFPSEPSVTYTVTIAPGMADAYGNTIDNPFTFSYSTAPYSPDVQLSVPGPVGYYNAYRDQTEVFVTHRNVSRLDLRLYSVPLTDFVPRLTNEETAYDPSYNFTPSEADLLRSWQILSVAPENALRYELLDLGGEGSAPASCPASLPSRVNVGDMVVVTTEPDPLRARSTPPDGEVVDLLYRDYQMEILSGPVCGNDLLWWEVRLRDGGSAWIAESDLNEYFIEVLTATQTTEVDVTQAADSGVDHPLEPGIYFLNVSSPETISQGYYSPQHFMVVATANLIMKSSVDSVTVWATDIETGEPIANAPLSLYASDTDSSAVQTITDENGIAVFNVPRIDNLYVPRTVVLQSADQFGIASSNWSDGVDPWRFSQFDQFYPVPYRFYLYTDRPVYRQGQPVYFRGVIRRQDDVTYTPPDMQTIPVTIYDDQGEVIEQRDMPLSEFGTFNGEFDLADDASVGYYRIEAQIPTESQNQYLGGSVSFSVAEYRLPEFQVDLTPQAEEVVQGDTISLTLDSRYFFGGAVSNADVEYNVIANPYYFDYSGPGGRYEFSDFDYDAGPSEFFGPSQGAIASGTGTTDAQGRLTIEVPAELEDDTQSQVFTIEAVVTDESQQPVAGRAEVVVHKGLIYVGVRPEEYVAVAGQETAFNLIAVDWDGNPVANQTVDVQIVERRWSSVQEEDDAGRTTWTYEVEDNPVADGQVVTGDDGRADFNFTPPNGGIFKVIITSQDSQGNEVRASTFLWVSGTDYVSWRQQNSNRIDLIADKDSYTIGDVAQILITSPFQGATEALVTVERGDVLTTERLTLDTNSYVYELPIAEDFSPNVYVSVIIIKGVDETNPVAAFRMGLIQLGVETSRKEITIDITPDTERAGPGDTVTYTLRATDYAGNPVQAEVGVGLTDLASLSIAQPNSEPLLTYFYGQQGLGVRTSLPLTINTDQITQTVLDTVKGGGGGGGGGGGIFDIREDFVDTAYWNAALVTNESGEATFQVTLPDNLTTWRLDARAVTSGADGLTLVGQDTFDLLSTKPLLIRPVTPRFFVVADQVTLAAVVNNNTDAAQTVEVQLEGTGVTLQGDAAQTFVIEAGGRQRVEWPVTVDNVSSVNLTFLASNEDGSYNDASKPPLGQGDDRLLPVYRYNVPETVGTGGVLRDAESITEAFVLPERFSNATGMVTVSLEPSLAATALNGLDFLETYSGDSTESIVSAFLPNVMTYRALTELGVSNPSLQNTLNTQVQLAIQRLYARQKVDGGWGWFGNDRSDALVTAYALIGLTEALNSGFVVDPAIISRAQGFLQTQFIVPDLGVSAWRLDRQAFVLYALARSGAADVSRTVTLFDSRDRLSLYAKGLLALTLDLLGSNDASRIDTLISDVFSSAITSANGTHWEEATRDDYNWNTNTRTTAIILAALTRLRPDSDLLPNIVRWLMTARRADAWETTQETAWAVMALNDYMRSTGELQPDYALTLSYQDSPVLQSDVNASNVTVPQGFSIDMDAGSDQTTVQIDRTTGPGVLYYTAYLTVDLPVPEIEPLDRGVIVERRYTLADDPDLTPITEAHIGQLVQVRLTIIAPNDLHYAVIEDPIPAGSDAVNPNLETSQQIGTQPEVIDTSNPLSYGWGWWWFSNIAFEDERVVLTATYLPAGTYEFVYTIRPGLEGVYNVIPSTGYEFYFPEVYGRGAGSTFTILPEE